MSEYSTDPAVIALANLRAWAANRAAITQGQALEAIRTVSIALAESRNDWWIWLATGAFLGALAVLLIQLIGRTHP